MTDAPVKGRSLTTASLLIAGLITLVVTALVLMHASDALQTRIDADKRSYSQRMSSQLATGMATAIRDALAPQAAILSVPEDQSSLLGAIPMATSIELITPDNASTVQERYNFVVQDLVNGTLRGEDVQPEAVRNGRTVDIYWATRTPEGVLLVRYGDEWLQHLQKLTAPFAGETRLVQTLTGRTNEGIIIFRSGSGDLSAPETSQKVVSFWHLAYIPGTDLPPPTLTALLPWGSVIIVTLLAALLILVRLLIEARQPLSEPMTVGVATPVTTTTHHAHSHALPYADETISQRHDLPEVDDPDDELPRTPVTVQTAHAASVDAQSCPIPQHIFRAYDIRGLVDTELTNDVMTLLGRALGSEVRSRGFDRINLAWDGRLSSERLANHLQDGLLNAGCSVNRLGMLPTGALYWATHELDAVCGVMITGSHNPVEYNGLKIVIDRMPMAEDELLALWYRAQRNDFTTGYAGARQQNIYEDYIERIEDDVQINRDLTVVIDAGNGVAGPMAVDLFRELGVEVIDLFCDIDGNFPNHHPDPGEPENLEYLRKSVLSNGADLGLAFDGDGDRVAVLDNEGNIIWPDRLLMLLIEDILPRKPGSDVLFDVKSSRHLAPLINRLGGRPTMWKTGHSLMKRKLHELKASVGGEFSGHFYISERWYGFDCGLYAGARLLEILANRRATVADVFRALPADVSTAEITLKTTEDRKFSLITQLAEDKELTAGARVFAIDGLRLEYADGWGLIRASNTTPRLTLRFAGDSEATIARIQTSMKQALTRYAPEIQIPF